MATEGGKGLARAALTFGLGAHFGAPGYIIGGALGVVLFPPDAPEAPDPYSQVNYHSSSENTPIALCYGTVKHQGNFIFKGELRYKKVEEGGKGGQKTVTGYKYWTDAGIGICKGPVDVTRMWKGDEIFVYENDTSITFHEGYDDQAVDADFDALVDNAVPYKNLAWAMFDNYYLGEDNNTFPTISSEIHHFPWTDDMDTVAPFVYNKINETTIGGIVKKDKFDDIIVANRTTIRVYSNDWTLKKTIDTSELALNQSLGWDMFLSYIGGQTFINLVSVKTGTTKNAIDLWRFKKSANSLLLPAPYVVRENVDYWRLLDDTWVNEMMCDSNMEYAFVVYRGGTTAYYLMKLSVGSPGTPLATYNVTAAHVSMDTPRAISMNNDYLFYYGINGCITMFGFDGTLKDYEDSAFDNTVERIEAIYGGPNIVGYSFGVDPGMGDPRYDLLTFASYDRDTEQFVDNNVDPIVIDSNWWTGAQSPFNEASMFNFCIENGPDGTLIVSGEYSGGASSMQLILDANPGHIIYHMMVVERGMSTARIDIDALETVGSRCCDNRIGMSFRLIAKKNIGAVIRDILGHVQGQAFRDNQGRFSFFMPSSDDVSQGTITLADVCVQKNEGAPDYSIVQTTEKDIGLCANRLNITYTNRLNQYKQDATFPLDDMLAQDLDGDIQEENLDYQMFSNESVISKLAWKAWKISRHQNLMHTIPLNGRWLWLEPGMVVVINIPTEGFNSTRVRVFSIDDPALDVAGDLVVTFQMDDDYLTSFEDILYDSSLSASTDVGPPVEVTPVVWEEDARYNNDTYTLAITAIREDDVTAYCDVYISLDTADSFFFAGRLTQFANVGDLVDDIIYKDRKIVVNSDAYDGSAFPTYTRTNQRNGLSYCLMGILADDDLGLEELEFFTYREAVADGDDMILKHCVRGKDYTHWKAHASADDTVVLLVGMDYFKREFDSLWVGKKIYVKLVPSNSKGASIDIDEVATYEYTIQGHTRHGTHSDRVQINDSVRGPLGFRTKTTDTDVEIIWEYTNRNSGMGAQTLDAWEYGGFQMGDVDDYDIIVYQSDGETVQATHLGIGLVATYTYTNAQNTTDFGGSPSDHFWIGVRPVVTGRGLGRGVPDIMKQEVVRV